MFSMATVMSRLKPGATYIYERADGRVYAREFGAAPNTRMLIGYDSEVQEYKERRYYMNHINDVITMCETDLAMKDLLERLFVLYNLKKSNE